MTRLHDPNKGMGGLLHDLDRRVRRLERRAKSTSAIQQASFDDVVDGARTVPFNPGNADSYVVGVVLSPGRWMVFGWLQAENASAFVLRTHLVETVAETWVPVEDVNYRFLAADWSAGTTGGIHRVTHTLAASTVITGELDKVVYLDTNNRTSTVTPNLKTASLFAIPG